MPDNTNESVQGDLVVSAEQLVQVEEVDGRKRVRFDVPSSMQGHTFMLELTPADHSNNLSGPFRIEYVLGSEFIIHQSELPPFRLEEGFSYVAMGTEFAKLKIDLKYFDAKNPKESRSAQLVLKTKNGVLQRLVVETDQTDFSIAVRQTGQIMADLLDALSFMKRIPITVRHIEVYGSDQKSQVRYVTLPYGLSKIGLDDFRQATSFPHRLRAPLRLFREAVSSNKPHYRLLCLYRIREAFEAIQRQNDIEIRTGGGTSDRPRRLLAETPVTRTYFAQFVGKRVNAFLDHVRSTYRLPVAHGNLDEFFKLVLDPADVRIDHRVDFTNAALIPVIAELLQDEIDLMVRHNLHIRPQVK